MYLFGSSVGPRIVIAMNGNAKQLYGMSHFQYLSFNLKGNVVIY